MEIPEIPVLFFVQLISVSKYRIWGPTELIRYLLVGQRYESQAKLPRLAS